MPKLNARVVPIRRGRPVSEVDQRVVDHAYELWVARAFRGVSPRDALLTAMREAQGKGLGALFLVPKRNITRGGALSASDIGSSFKKETKMSTLLVLEDESFLMGLLRRMLKEYTLLEAVTAEQAIRLFDNRDGPIDLLLADVTLPVSSGIQVALALRSQIPDLPVLLTSGYAANSFGERDTADLEALGTKSVAVLQKPFPAAELSSTVRQLLGAPRTRTASDGS